MALSASIQISDQDIYQQSSVANAELIGQVAGTSDGRTFRYARSAGALTRGQLTEPGTVVANYANRTLSVASAAGSNRVTVTLGTTATADQFIGHYLVVNDGTGEGQGVYYITGNTAATAGTSNATTITFRGALTIALTNASDVTIQPSQESNVIQHTAAATTPAAGAPVVAVTSGYWFWNQVGGMASILSAGAITKNALAIASAAVAGAATIDLAASVTQLVGFAPELTVDTEYSPLVLTIG